MNVEKIPIYKNQGLPCIFIKDHTEYFRVFGIYSLPQLFNSVVAQKVVIGNI